MFILKRFGDYTLPAANPDETVGTGGATITNPLGLPGGGAFDSLRESVAQFGDRVLTKKAVIYASTEALAMAAYRALQAEVGKRDRLYREWDYGSAEEWVDARLINIEAQRKAADALKLDVTMQFEIYSAYWRSLSPVGEWYLNDGELLDYGLVLDGTATTFTLDSSPKILTVTNGGNAIVTDCKINIDAGSADITAVKIEADDIEIDYAGTITAGDELMIDCGAYSVTNNLVNDRDNLSLGSDHKINEWFRLLAGANSVTITITGGSTDSQITYGYSNGWI